MIEIIAPLGCIGFLAYGAYKDVTTREIPDEVWILMGVAGVVLRVGDHQWKMMALSFGVCSVLSFVLAVSNLFGGADIKALLALSFMVPTYPGVVFPVFVVSVFNNVVIFKVAEMVVVFCYNVVKGSTFEGISIWKKLLLFLTGFPLSRERLDYRFLPLQDEEGNLHLMPDIDVDVEKFKQHCSLEKLWVTYGSPLILYITLGCVIAFLKGDLILNLVLRFT